MSTHSFFSVMSFEFIWYLRGKKGIKKTHTRCSYVQQFLHNISLRLDDHESSNEKKKKIKIKCPETFIFYSQSVLYFIGTLSYPTCYFDQIFTSFAMFLYMIQHCLKSVGSYYKFLHIIIIVSY